VQKLKIKLYDTLKFGQPLKEIDKNIRKCRKHSFWHSKAVPCQRKKLSQEIIS
jgi:hypothetical protein